MKTIKVYTPKTRRYYSVLYFRVNEDSQVVKVLRYLEKNGPQTRRSILKYALGYTTAMCWKAPKIGFRYKQVDFNIMEAPRHVDKSDSSNPWAGWCSAAFSKWHLNDVIDYNTKTHCWEISNMGIKILEACNKSF